MSIKLIYSFLLQLLICQYVLCEQRPFYNIAHMVNGIEEIQDALDNGANAIESDIQFSRDGSVLWVYHGAPCDCSRNCTKKAKLSDYLDYLRNTTDPIFHKNYHDQMALQFFDLKLTAIRSQTGKYRAGTEMANHIIDHLWGEENESRNLIKVLIYLNGINDINVARGFLDTFEKRNASNLLTNVGYDGGYQNNPKDVKKMFDSLNISSNIWQGDGITNCFSATHSDSKLDKLLSIRNDPEGYIDKVYKWTVDMRRTMASALDKNVDGMITNVPGTLSKLINEKYSKEYKLATIYDDPFNKIIVEDSNKIKKKK